MKGVEHNRPDLVEIQSNLIRTLFPSGLRGGIKKSKVIKGKRKAAVILVVIMQLLWLLLLTLAPSVTPSSFNDSNSLLWGAYRPNLYFGLRPRLPQSLMTGLVWFGTQDYESFISASLFSMTL